MKLYSFAVGGLLGYASASFLPEHDLCPWSALQPNTLPFCLPGDLEKLKVVDPASVSSSSSPSPKPSSNRHDTRKAKHGFVGPHACSGKYCVWSSYSGPGIAIVTTNVNKRRIGTRLQPLPPADNSHFRTTPVPGKGLGLVATRRIPRGQRIMAAQPALMVHRLLIDDLEIPELTRLLDIAAGKLPAVRREAFMAQASELGGDPVADIMFTNSFQMNVDGGADDGTGKGHHFGSFPDISYFNHDCRPNVAFYIDQNFTHHTHAVRDIETGEELTISYLDSFGARLVRQSRAHASWGFSCSCAQCSLPEGEAAESDARLVSIDTMEKRIMDLTSKSTTPAMIEQLVSLYRQERIDHKTADVYTMAALNYNTWGDADEAMRYANLSIEQGRLEHGPNAPDTAAMQAILANPTTHWSWNQRPRR